jgi:predicted TIM-barrel fold metal-dependent hydrolase
MVWMGELCGYVTGFSYETPGFAAAINLATDLGMVVQIHNDLPEDMARLCVEHPNTTFVLAHLGDSPEEIEERIHLAVRFPNLYLDISGHGYQRMGVLELAVHEAGADRVLFGSDFTVNDPAGVIARIQMADFDTETKNRLLGGNTNRLLQEHGWKAKGL